TCAPIKRRQTMNRLSSGIPRFQPWEDVKRINVKVHGNTETEINGSGPRIESGDLERLNAQLDQLQDGDWLICSGSRPQGINPSIFKTLIRRLGNKKVNVVLDTTGEALIQALSTKPFLIKPNHHELEELFGYPMTLRAKQPKRGAVAAEKGYIEVNNYPRGDKAVITYTENGMQETIELGNTASALDYEIMDMQEYVLHDRKAGLNNLRQVRDVMKTLTEIRRQWGMLYPFE
uniref:PfkB family carbohydrate kinase n=1 Tax=uncultured Dubosiella sp. TaxID=1937011 RepID=UPI00263B5664